MGFIACPETLLILVIAVFFLLLFLVMVVFLIHNVCIIKKRYFSILFLLLLCVHSLLRSFYFGNWAHKHFYDDPWVPINFSNDTKSGVLEVLLVTLPGVLFLSVVSLNTHSFAHLVYVVLEPGIDVPHFFSMLQLVVNISLYFWLSLFCVMASGPYHNLILKTLTWIIAATNYLNSTFFVIFSWQLKRHLSHPPYSSGTMNTYLSFINAPTALFFSAIVCFLGCSSQIILLVINVKDSKGDNFTFFSLIVTFIFAEYIPEIAMAVMQSATTMFLNNWYLTRSVSNQINNDCSLLDDRLSTVTEEPRGYSKSSTKYTKTSTVDSEFNQFV